MSTSTTGIHHITAIAGDAQRNIDFYTGVLGLRLVKVTINFDDPGTWHFTYGDYAGRPGSLLTFLIWDGAPIGQPGTGQATTVSFLIPDGSMDYWTARLHEHGVGFDGPGQRFDETVISFIDPEGIDIELVSGPPAPEHGDPEFGPVPRQHAIRGLHGVTLTLASYERTAGLLTQTFGFQPVRETGSRFRYTTGVGGPGTFVDVVLEPSPRAPRGEIAAGTVHHVAFRARDAGHQQAIRDRLLALRYDVTEVRQRHYFLAIYFREPGGVNLEVATDGPGMDIDEPLDQLGTSLKYPPRYEHDRESLESLLRPVRLPEGKIVP